MIGTLRAEFLKLRTIRTTYGLLLGVVALVSLQVVSLILTAGINDGARGLTDPSVARSVWSSSGSATILVLTIGIIMMTSEYRHMTITSTFLATPIRGRVLAAKMFAAAVAGLLTGVLCVLLVLGVASALLATREHATVANSTIVAISGGAILAYAIYAVLGVAVGALIRIQPLAVMVSVVYVFIVEPLIAALVPKVGRWLPGGATNAILQNQGFGNFTESDYLPIGAAALLLVGYGLAFAIIASRTTLRRDIT